MAALGSAAAEDLVTKGAFSSALVERYRPWSVRPVDEHNRSVLVYSNELYRAATPPPIFSNHPGPRLTDGQLSEAALRLYPGYVISRITRARNRDQAVDVWLRRGKEIQYRLFDPRAASILGLPSPAESAACPDLLICTTICSPERLDGP